MEQVKKLPLKVILVILVLVLIFSGDQISRKMILIDLPPMWSGTLAYTMASLAFFIYLKQQKIAVLPPTKTIFLAHVISALLFIAVNVTGLYGVKYTFAGRASVFIFAHPLFVALFASLGKRGEKISIVSVVGLIIAFAGVIIVFKNRLQGGVASLLGDVLMIISSALLALMIVHIRNLSREIGAKVAVFWQITMALPVFWILTLSLEDFPQHMGYYSISGLIYQALAVIFIGFVWRATLIEKYTASSITSFFFLTPVIAVILGYLLLDEPLNASIFWGGLIVGIGVLVNIKGAR
jgi:drug/metabolite transporter (DMT)-like permease